jgi:hypothetical protein
VNSFFVIINIVRPTFSAVLEQLSGFLSLFNRFNNGFTIRLSHHVSRRVKMADRANTGLLTASMY